MDEPIPASATVRRLLVGSRLRTLRESRGISREEAGYVIRASESKMSRLELGRVSFKMRDVADLLVFYGVTDPAERDALLSLAHAANEPGWWRDYEAVTPGWFTNYIGLEEAAAQIRTYEVQFVPGLLQTPEYARAVIASAVPPPSPDDVLRGVQLRAIRQRVLSRSNPPHLWAVLDEAALRRPVGSREVMRDQLRHLVARAASPFVSLQVLPLQFGSHAAAGGPFSILRFSDSDLADVVYVEQLMSSLYFDKVEHVDRYTEVLNRLSVESLTPDDTVVFLTGMLAEAA
jgi:transcriptional regulator with XRE-family HTH domain